MKKLLLILLLAPALGYGQSNYSNGYKDGYCSGCNKAKDVSLDTWCVVKGNSIGIGGYTDGYAEGFKKGYDDCLQKKQKSPEKSKKETVKSPVKSFNDEFDAVMKAAKEEEARKIQENLIKQEYLKKQMPPIHEIEIPLKIDLSDYTHFALIKYNGVWNFSVNGYYTFVDENTRLFVKQFINKLSAYPHNLNVINPYKYDKKKAKKDFGYLSDIKNKKWLYISWYETALTNVDCKLRVEIKNSENEILFKGIFINQFHMANVLDIILGN